MRFLFVLLAPVGILLAAFWPRAFGRLFVPKSAKRKP